MCLLLLVFCVGVGLGIVVTVAYYHRSRPPPVQGEGRAPKVAVGVVSFDELIEEVRQTSESYFDNISTPSSQRGPTQHGHKTDV
jgi:hypothetical protein